MPRMPLWGGLRIGVLSSRAVDAAVGDGEDATAQILELDLALAGLGGVVDDVALDVGEALLVAVADHRNDEPLSVPTATPMS